MKNKLLTLILFVWFISYPIYAHTMYAISLNGLTYMPKHAIYELNNTLYISTEDFTALTYSNVTLNKANTYTYTVTIQNHTIDFTPNERIVRINQKPTILVHMPLKLKESVYLPITILDAIKYPYNLNQKNRILEIVPIKPYAKTSDSYQNHLLVNTQLDNLSSAIKTLISENKANALLLAAKKNDDYISFIDNTDKDYLLTVMNSDLLKGKSLQVAFRELDLISPVPNVSTLSFSPLKVTLAPTHLTAQIGDDTVSYNCVWAAYRPSDQRLKIDVSKTLDATLMRVLYEYYRDQYDLKDDLYFSPVVTLKNERVDSLSFTTYSDHISNQKNVYDIVVYKIPEETTITYMIDLMLHHKQSH